MSLQMRWVGKSELDRVALTRARCYAGSMKELSRFQEGIRADQRAKEGDYLLAERDGKPLGTATCLSLSMWARGARIPCQGVAYVGTIKTHRRGSGTPGGGVASQIMRECIRGARERGEVVSALMPFRASFYEHFGYGAVERRCMWTVPLAVMPAGGFDSVGFLEPDDAGALAACRQRVVEQGQCDIERSPAGWKHCLAKWEDRLVVIDRATGGSIRGYLAFQQVQKNEKDAITVNEIGYENIDGLRRLLHFLASLRDQYTFAGIMLPADVPLNWMLRETQLPHRLVNHPHAEVRPTTRMQIRVLDHQRLIAAMRLPEDQRGRVVVSVKETEGDESRFALDYSAGRASAPPTNASPQFVCADRTWAPIVCGELKATTAVQLGLATSTTPTAAEALSVFACGPAPFCQEYF